mgnify:CR=1 FL=1
MISPHARSNLFVLLQVIVAFSAFALWPVAHDQVEIRPTDAPAKTEYRATPDNHLADTPRPMAQIKKYPRAFAVLLSVVPASGNDFISWDFGTLQEGSRTEQYFQSVHARPPPCLFLA